VMRRGLPCSNSRVSIGARREITVAATHGLFLDGARDRLSHDALRQIFVTDTVAITDNGWSKMKVVSAKTDIRQPALLTTRRRMEDTEGY